MIMPILNMRTFQLVTVISTLVAGAAGSHWNLCQPFQLTLRRESNTSSCDIVSFGKTQLHKSLPPATKHIIREQNTVPFPGPLDNDEIIHFLSYSTNELWLHAQLECSNDLSSVGQGVRNGFDTEAQVAFGGGGVLLSTLEVLVPPLEVVSLLQSGASDNRIDLAFFSDGCEFTSVVYVYHWYILGPHYTDTTNEKDKFLEDAMRLVTDLSANQTFATVKSLLNFWAVFSPSQEVNAPPITTRH
jgi:hypothetical protein